MASELSGYVDAGQLVKSFGPVTFQQRSGAGPLHGGRGTLAGRPLRPSRGAGGMPSTPQQRGRGNALYYIYTSIGHRASSLHYKWQKLCFTRILLRFCDACIVRQNSLNVIYNILICDLCRQRALPPGRACSAPQLQKCVVWFLL